jgi:hypothetical protein
MFCTQKLLKDFDEELGRTGTMKQSKDTFPHVVNATRNQIPQDFDCLRIVRLPHPPNSQDLAPCDFWAFRMRKRKLEGLRFGDQIEMLLAVNTINSTISHEQFISVLEERKSRLCKCFDKGGESLETD